MSPADTFTPPKPSRASRKPSLHTKGSHRGSFAGTAGSTFLYESDLEAKIAIVNGIRPDVVDVLDQPPTILYRDRSGVVRAHTFDQRVTLSDGRTVLVAVKPRAKAMRRKLLEEIAVNAGQVPPDVASHALVMDERDAPADAVRDAKLIHAVRRDPPSEADAVVLRLVGGISGAVTMRALVEASGLGADAYRAVVRLVAAGILQKRQTAALGYASLLAPAAAAIAGDFA